MRFRFSQDVWVLIVLLLFFVVTSVFVTTRGDENGGMEVIPRRTSYSSRPGGLRALYETLGQTGYPVQRHTAPLTGLASDGVLFIISPETPISSQDWQAVRAWVERGNLLILADGIDMDDSRGKTSAYGVVSAPSIPSFLSPGASSFRVPAGRGIFEEDWGSGQEFLVNPPYG